MGLVYGRITLSNPVKPELKPMEVKCLVDTGSTYLCILKHIAEELQISITETKYATLADGTSQPVPYGGPIWVKFGNRNCFVGAVVFGDEILLGAIPMEDMDLVVIPKLLQLSVNPESPHMTRGYAKCS